MSKSSCSSTYPATSNLASWGWAALAMSQALTVVQAFRHGKHDTGTELQLLSGQHTQRCATAAACSSSQAPSLARMPAEAHWPFPITGFTQRVPCGRSHIPAFWTKAYILSWGTCTDPMLADEVEEVQVKSHPSWPQHPARSQGCTARERTASAIGRAEECGNWGWGAGQGQTLPHLETSRSRPEQCGGRKSSDALRQGQAAALMRTARFHLPAPASLQPLWRGFHGGRESLGWNTSLSLPCKLCRPTTNTSFQQ